VEKSRETLPSVGARRLGGYSGRQKTRLLSTAGTQKYSLKKEESGRLPPRAAPQGGRTGMGGEMWGGVFHNHGTKIPFSTPSIRSLDTD